jgi:Zn-dependent protease
MQDLNPEFLALGVAWYAVFVVSTSLHEAAHAWAALRLGDPTAYHGGQVTVNPLPHIEREPLGMVIVPILSYLVGGWLIGWASAPYDPFWASRYPRRAALMALAGPAANLSLVLLAAIIIRVGLLAGVFVQPDIMDLSFTQITAGVDDGIPAAAAKLVSILFSLNVVLFTFNLIPLPPLDGSAALGLILPATQARHYQEFMRQPAFALMGMIVAWRIAAVLVGIAIGLALTLTYLGA